MTTCYERFIISIQTKDGLEVKARQYGTHTWKRLNNEWRLVHEHLTIG